MNEIINWLNKHNFEVLKHKEGFNLYILNSIIVRIKSGKLEQFYSCLPLNSWIKITLNELEKQI